MERSQVIVHENGLILIQIQNEIDMQKLRTDHKT